MVLEVENAAITKTRIALRREYVLHWMHGPALGLLCPA